MTKILSPREQEIIELCVQGLTNDAIADRLGISIGTVNTYWLRIRMKVGGSGRTDTVVRVIKERAEQALSEAKVERSDLTELLVARDEERVSLRATLALVNLALERMRCTVWATDVDLRVTLMSSGEDSDTRYGVAWEVGETVQRIFKTDDVNHPAVSAHFRALQGEEVVERLTAAQGNLILRTLPLRDEVEPSVVVGCISILTSAE
jgi:DNA-binding CsgD family transcriptional regulator